MSRITQNFIENADIPSASVIIVNYNSGNMLRKCLEALARQSWNDFEVIIVDNGSRDQSLDCIKDCVLPVTVIKLGQNTGFAHANNRGAEIARGKWLVLLNADAFPTSAWLYQLLGATRRYTDFAFFTSHQVKYREPHILDGTGDMYATDGRAWRRDYGALLEFGVQEDDEVFGACAAAALIKAECFFEIGGFDENYFCYFEDVDLSLRLRLAGCRCMHVAKAVVYHVGSATSGGEEGDFSVYHGYRNLVWTYFKSMPLPLLLKYLPDHIRLNLQQIKRFFAQGKVRLILRCKWDAVKFLPNIFAQRRKVQRLKRISSEALEKVMKRDSE